MANKQQQNIGQDVKNAGKQRNTLGKADQQASYWRDQYSKEPYVTKGEKFDAYEPAYRTGSEGRERYAGQRFEEVEGNLQQDYEAYKGDTALGWDKARQACRAAWDRVDQSMSSQTDRQQLNRQAGEQTSRKS